MSTLKTVRHLIQKEDYGTIIDLSTAYDSVSIDPSGRKYMQFQFSGTTYQYRGCPNGLAEAPRIFTQLTKPIVATANSLGIRLNMYLDDILILNQNADTLRRDCTIVIQLLTGLGFVINEEKTIVEPSKKFTYLGITFNTELYRMELPTQKREKIQALCKTTKVKTTVTARELASLVGKLQAAAMVVHSGNVRRNSIHAQITEATKDANWERKIRLNKESIKEIVWWEKHIEKYNGRPITSPEPQGQLHTDASKVGWGAVIKKSGEEAQGRWTSAEIEKYHINHLELKAVHLGLQALMDTVTNKHIQVWSDNVTAVTYLTKGGTKSTEMNNLAQTIWDWMLYRKNTLTARYIPGGENGEADQASRKMKDGTDYQLCPKVFKQINRKLGPLKLDLYANHWNRQTTRYFSRYPQPETLGLDAMIQTWDKTGNYAYPPHIMIPGTINKAVRDKVEMVIIAPVWRSQPWYSLLLQHSVDHPIRIPNRIRDAQGVKPENVNKIKIAAWNLSGEDWKLKEFQNKLPLSSGTKSEQAHRKIMNMHGDSGLAGVVRGRVLRFNQLYQY